MIIGFFAYRFGVAINIANNSIVSEFVSMYAPKMFSFEQTALLLEFGGGIILLLGIILSVTAFIETKVSYLPAPAAQEEIEEAEEVVRRCKYCSAEIEDEIFCPGCGKSQQ